MEDLLRIPFVLLALAAIILCYLLDQKRRNPATEQDKTASRLNLGMADHKEEGIEGAPQNKKHTKHAIDNKHKWKNSLYVALAIAIFFIAIIITIIFLSEVETYINQYFKEPFPDFKSAFLLKHRSTLEYMGSGLIYGVVLYGFYRFVLKHDDARGPLPKLMVAVWVTLIVVLTVAGLFKAETKMIMASIKRLETPAGAIEFANAEAGDDLEISISYDAQTTTKTDTNFQAGAKRLEEALDSVESDFKKIIRFCRKDLMAGPYCAPFAGDADAKEVEESQEGLVTAMAVTYGYARAIKPIATCLRAYACFYENGVPIQDDLSEIAASYAIPPSELAKFSDCTGGKNEDPICEPLGSILGHLTSFKYQFKNKTLTENEKLSCPPLEECLKESENNLPKANDVIHHRDAVLAAGKPGVAGHMLPYRPMISASLLTASGYPEEAVGHMEREYKKLRREFGRTEEGGESGSLDFVETVLRLRLLNELQQVSDQAKKQQITLEYQEKEQSLAIAFLEKNMNVDGRNREELLEKCVKGITGIGYEMSKSEIELSDNFKNILNDDDILQKNVKGILKDTKSFEDVKLETEKWKKETPSTVKGAWDDYVSNFLFYFVNADFNRLQSRVGTQQNQTEGQIEDRHLASAEEWWNIATKKPNLIKDCFSRMSFASSGLYRFLTFQMVYTYGLLNAQKASWLSQKAELARSGLTEGHVILVDMNEVQDDVCKGYTGLRRAYNIGKVLMEDPDWKETVEKQMRGTSSMLRRLVPYMEWLKSVEGGCLNRG